MDELTREFLVESQEGLDRMERCLTDLENRPGDAALIAEIFRSVHTIKGTTGFLGYKRLEKIAHAGENLLGMLREGNIRASTPVVSELLHLLDALRSILCCIEREDGEGTGDDALLIRQLEILQTSAGVAALPARKEAWTPHTGTASARSRENVPAPPAEETVLDTPPAAISTTEAASPAPTAEPEGSRSAGTAIAAAESTLRVDVMLLNCMMNLVGELVLTRNQIMQAAVAVPDLTLLSRRLDMITSDLREAVMKARMQPVSNVFAKIPRMVRDLSQSLGRRVRLEMDGQDTELDKSLLEAIKDPLTHAVRNALDHGIEAPEVRMDAGKDPEGTLKVRAFQEGSHVIIEISDDGAGVAVEQVRQKALDRSLISAEQAARQSDRDLMQLIFLPGFSTASAVTNVSGRGVGMDVVRTNVEKIGGKVELDSWKGKGTMLRMRIPLTLAIIPALIVHSVGQSFAVPQAALLELVHIPAEKAAAGIEWIENVALYRLRGALLPLVFLDQMLAPDRVLDSIKERESYIAVLETDGRRFGVVVDGLADPEEIVVKPLNSALKGIGLYSGATVLGSGRLALILDPTAIAVRAGITTLGEETNVRPGETPALQTSRRGDYLLVEIAGQRAAVALDDVLRIEQLAVSRIERISSRPVINFQGQILPVEDAAGLLGDSDGDAQIIVVVCRDGDRHVGFVVTQVLDVTAGTDLFEAGSQRRTEAVMGLKDRVTGLINLAQIPPPDYSPGAALGADMAEVVA
jgi:two-component system chemotaxis sensor kinase CheA